jgi:MFS family permease
MTMIRVLGSLPRTVWLLGLVSLFNDTTSELIYPLVPLFLASVLLAGPAALGIIEGIAEATASLLKLFSGVLTDRFGRAKAWVVTGYALAALSRPLFTLAASWPGVLVLRFADRVGKGLRTSPRDALLAGSVAADRRGLAFGLHRAMDNAGAVLGPLLAALLLAQGVALRDIFLWAVLPGILTVLLALGIREPPARSATSRPTFSWRFADLPPAFRRYLLVLALFTLGNSSNMFLLLRARELGVPEAQVPLLWALTSAVAMLFSMPLSALSDRLGRLRLILAGWVVYGLFYLAMGLSAPSQVWLWPLFAFYGLFLAATEGAEKALVADLAPGDRLGTAYGWFNLTTGAILLPASILFGWLYQGFGAQAAFAYSAASALTAALLLPLWALSDRKTPSATSE